MNYRSVVVLRKARLVGDPVEKARALHAFVDHVAPGRWDEVRKPTPKELDGTTVLALPLNEVSAKVRTGPPIDDEEDYGLPIWAGVVPLRIEPGEPIADPRLAPGLQPSGLSSRPAGSRQFRRNRRYDPSLYVLQGAKPLS